MGIFGKAVDDQEPAWVFPRHAQKEFCEEFIGKRIIECLNVAHIQNNNVTFGRGVKKLLKLVSQFAARFAGPQAPPFRMLE